MRYPCLIQQDLLSKINLQVKCFSRFNIKFLFAVPLEKNRPTNHICELRVREQRAIYIFVVIPNFFWKRSVSNTRDSVSSGYREWSSKYDARRSIFDEIRGVWIADETLSQVFDISSQSKQKLRSKRRSSIVKIYAN